MCVSACSMMHDDLDHCKTQLRVNFKYDMNMKFANAFEHEVKKVTLYVFNSDNGQLAFTKTETAEAVNSRGGYMEIDGLEPGHYALKVWAEGEERQLDSYTYGQPGNTGDAIEGLNCRISRTNRDVKHDLTPLFHGYIADADLTDLSTGEVKTVTVPLIKDTNNIKVVLQNMSGSRLDANDFVFTIDDCNGFLGYDNAVLPDDSITYHAWSQYDGMVGNESTEASSSGATRTEESTVSAVVAELTVNRLMVGGTHPRLTVRNTEGKTVLSIPFTDYALLVKGNYNRKMTDQEYLDRQDEYNFIFFLDSNQNWLSASIIVNSWRVVLNNTDL